VKNRNQENLEAKIIFHYHSLEKGLSNINFRAGFGKNAYTQLIDTMHLYDKKGFDKKSIAYQSGLSVLNEYVIKHENSNVNTDVLKKEIQNLAYQNNIYNLGGVYNLQKKEVVEKSKGDFKSLALNRFSVRDFANKKIDVDLINQALNIAKKTPSVCNRQPWHTYVIRNKDLINSVLEVQGGFRGHGNNLDTLILVASNNNYLSNYTERNQGFTDCGMYSMSLIYSLQYFGLATCALNANLPLDRDYTARKILKIPDNQNLVMFIAVGEYEDTFKTPKSPRDDISTKTTFY
jgi:nitroreductase